jgi:hypothetical protein
MGILDICFYSPTGNNLFVREVYARFFVCVRDNIFDARSIWVECANVTRDNMKNGVRTSLVARSSCGRCTQHLRRIRGCDARASGMNLAHYTKQMLRATRAVSFGSLCRPLCLSCTSNANIVHLPRARHARTNGCYILPHLYNIYTIIQCTCT